jgi:hypothetical protein
VSSETARLVVIGIASVAFMVWCAGFRFLVLAARKARPGEGGGDATFREGEAAGGNLLTGFAEVEGQARVLSDRVAQICARGELFLNVPFKITEKSDTLVRFERVQPDGQTSYPGQWVRQGLLSFVAIGGGRSRVEWVLELQPTRWLLRLGAAFLLAALVAIIAGCGVLLTFVVPSPSPAVRWQSVQMVQVVHFLWPPFLCGALYGRGRSQATARMQALANNLPYLTAKD